MTAGDPVCRGSSTPLQCHQAVARCWRFSVGLFAHPFAGSMDNFDRKLPTCVRTSPGKDSKSLPCLLDVPGVRVSRVGPTTVGHLLAGKTLLGWPVPVAVRRSLPARRYHSGRYIPTLRLPPPQLCRSWFQVAVVWMLAYLLPPVRGHTPLQKL